VTLPTPDLAHTAVTHDCSPSASLRASAGPLNAAGCEPTQGEVLQMPWALEAAGDFGVTAGHTTTDDAHFAHTACTNSNPPILHFVALLYYLLLQPLAHTRDAADSRPAPPASTHNCSPYASLRTSLRLVLCPQLERFQWQRCKQMPVIFVSCFIRGT
jgi:hypothetical protein